MPCLLRLFHYEVAVTMGWHPCHILKIRKQKEKIVGPREVSHMFRLKDSI